MRGQLDEKARLSASSRLQRTRAREKGESVEDNRGWGGGGGGGGKARGEMGGAEGGGGEEGWQLYGDRGQAQPVSLVQGSRSIFYEFLQNLYVTNLMRRGRVKCLLKSVGNFQEVF